MPRRPDSMEQKGTRKILPPPPASGPVDADTVRYTNETVEQGGIILVSLSPTGVKIKQLSEQKVFSY